MALTGGYPPCQLFLKLTVHRLLRKASHPVPDPCQSVSLPSASTMVVTVWDV